ncbi:MAG TPA: prepilin-type cleavage/methylation domain-containing protein [Anaeromyxobacteraceae bacterium]|nr:prepilin-type cleavage/methylation domain-containing protein [Anaeromyxobacteraceae bacterium]
MIVVAIIGILSSVALPNFQKLVLRARAAERHEVMVRVKKAVADLYLRTGSIPGGELTGDFQPPLPADAQKRMPNWRAPGWDQVFRSSEEVEGSTYYSYKVHAKEGDKTTPPILEVWAVGDLDGDGVPSTRYVKYERRDGVYQTDENDTTCTWVCPPIGQEDSVSF